MPISAICQPSVNCAGAHLARLDLTTATWCRGEGSYFEQSEGSHPAGPALLVLRTQHLQLLTVAPRFAGLSNGRHSGT